MIEKPLTQTKNTITYNRAWLCISCCSLVFSLLTSKGFIQFRNMYKPIIQTHSRTLRQKITPYIWTIFKKLPLCISCKNKGVHRHVFVYLNEYINTYAYMWTKTNIWTTRKYLQKSDYILCLLKDREALLIAAILHVTP